MDEDIIVRLPYDDFNRKIGSNFDIVGTVIPQFSRKSRRNGYKIVEARIKYKGRWMNEGDGLYLYNRIDFDHGFLEGLSLCLKAQKYDAGVVQNLRIRKFTSRECFRLMGVSDTDVDKIIMGGIPSAQQYKMAGNSIVVDVLEYIFRKLFVDKESDDRQLSLF